MKVIGPAITLTKCQTCGGSVGIVTSCFYLRLEQEMFLCTVSLFHCSFARAWTWSFISIGCRRYDWVALYLHYATCLHNLHRDNLVISRAKVLSSDRNLRTARSTHDRVSDPGLCVPSDMQRVSSITDPIAVAVSPGKPASVETAAVYVVTVRCQCTCGSEWECAIGVCVAAVSVQEMLSFDSSCSYLYRVVLILASAVCKKT